MPWSNPQKIHIFAPRTENPYQGDNWCEEVLGRVVLPLCRNFEEVLHWFFVGRYGKFNQPVPDERYMLPGTNISEFVAFRVSVQRPALHEFQERALELVNSEKCFADGWHPLNLTGDFPIERYCRPGAKPEMYERRIRLIVNLLDATSKLVLDSLDWDESRGWHIERNDNEDENPNGSMFESVHHLFCNTTDVPLDTLVLQNRQEEVVVTLQTYWSIRSLLKPKDWEQVAKVPMRY
jgi:hypothetical protein